MRQHANIEQKYIIERIDGIKMVYFFFNINVKRSVIRTVQSRLLRASGLTLIVFAIITFKFPYSVKFSL